MTDPDDAARLWADRSFLRDVQYKTDVNLTARQPGPVRPGDSDPHPRFPFLKEAAAAILRLARRWHPGAAAARS
jgi:hypothetical protein